MPVNPGYKSKEHLLTFYILYMVDDASVTALHDRKIKKLAPNHPEALRAAMPLF
jgi:hypothetical protein